MSVTSYPDRGGISSAGTPTFASLAAANADAAAKIAASGSPSPVVTTGTGATMAVYAWSESSGAYAVIPGTSGGVTPYTSFSALVSAVPSPSVGARALIDGGGLLVYTASGWLGHAGVFASDPSTTLAAMAPGSMAILTTGAIWTKGA